MMQNPRRPRGPKGKKIQFDRRLVYGVATHNGRTAKGKKKDIVSYMDKVDVNVLALQETKRTLGSEMWKVPGCVVFEHRPKKLEKGNLGIATIVRRDMFPESLKITENMIWIRCGRGQKKLVICNVYIPTGNVSEKRKEVIADLKHSIAHYAGDGKNVNLVVMGDFNMTPSEVKNWIRSQQIPLEVAPMSDKNEGTFERNGKRSIIDYILHYTRRRATCSSVSVTNTGISDHNGLSATLSFAKKQETSGPVYRSINRFAVLRRLEDDLDDSKFDLGRYQGLLVGESSEDVSRFLVELKDSLEKKGMVRTPNLGKRVKKPFPRKIKKEISTEETEFTQEETERIETIGEGEGPDEEVSTSHKTLQGGRESWRDW